MFRKLGKKLWVVGAVTIIAGILTFALSNFKSVHNLELKSLDWRFRMRGADALTDSSIVIVSVDDQTFSSIQTKWPYPRAYFTKLIQNLNEAGARLIVFDLEFTEPYAQDPKQDEELVRTAQKAGNVIFAGKVVTEFGANNTMNQYVVRPFPEVKNAHISWGLVNIVEDPDGFLRRYLLGIPLHGEFYPSLDVRALQALSGTEQLKDSPKKLVVGKYSIPKITPSTMLVNYVGPAKTFPTYSLVNVLDDFKFDIGPEDTDIFEMHKLWGTFRNKIVFVGAGAEELQDVKLTPFYDFAGSKRKMPGVEVHANALYTILHHRFIRRASVTAIYLVWLLLGLLAGFLVLFLKPIKAFPAVLLLGLGALLGILLLFTNETVWFPILSPLLMLGLSYLGNTFYVLGTEQREKLRYRRIFQKYVSKNVVDKMLETGRFPEFGGHRQKLTVLFSDIRSFTSFSEQYPPEEVVRRLTDYLTAMTDIVLQNDGTLDKFVGDEIMAIFGAPYFYENHALKACQAAHEMIQRVRKTRAEYAESGETYFDIGIGINTGDMILGNLGSRQIFDYTVIGDAVNLGARLEGVNKFYRTNVILSEYTYQEVKDHVVVRELDTIRVKGKNLPVKIYELLGIDQIPEKEFELLVQVYSQALEDYRSGEWYQALKGFRKILRYFPNDGPANLYIRRSLDLLENAPPSNWEPVHNFATK